MGGPDSRSTQGLGLEFGGTGLLLEPLQMRVSGQWAPCPDQTGSCLGSRAEQRLGNKQRLKLTALCSASPGGSWSDNQRV